MDALLTRFLAPSHPRFAPQSPEFHLIARATSKMWASLPDELVLCILRMIHDGALPAVTRLDKRCNRFTRERLSSLQRLTEEPFNVKTSDVFNLTLRIRDKQIGDQGITALASALGNGALASLKALNLSLNSIGDVGITALATALGSGALPSLEGLHLDENEIGDVGMTAFVGAVSSGALDHLTVCWRPTALSPCLETPHVHSPDSEHLFDVPYAVA
jgi:hypothetical protein